MTIQAISNKLQELSAQLEAGYLTADEIMEMTELARNLHERMIILQYKAFEEQVQIESEPDSETSDETSTEHEVEQELEPAAQEQQFMTAPAEPERETPLSEANAGNQEPEPIINTAQEPEVATEFLPEITSEDQKISEPEPEPGPSFRFETPEVSPNQISLIDSIEEIKRMEQSINESFKGEDGPSLAQRLKKKPVSNIKKSMSINQKFQFVSVLFQSDSAGFEVAIQRLDEATSYLEADEYIQNTLKDRYDWQMKNPVVKELLDLVERRFL